VAQTIDAGRVRQAHRLLASVLRLSRTFRRRQPDLILNWIGKTQLYCSPAAVLAGMSDRILWWQHDIPTGYWLDRLATALPAIAVGASSRTAAAAQARLFPHRPTFAVAPGTRVPAEDSQQRPLAKPYAPELPIGQFWERRRRRVQRRRLRHGRR